MATSTAPLLSDLELQYPGPRVEECGDETLAHLVAEASEPAFAALYERHYQALYRYCRSIVRDDTDAQDVLQSAWTRALVALRRGQRDAPVRPWLYRIVHNEAISLLRRRGRAAERPALNTDRVPSAEDRALDRERFWALLADLRQLPERPRGALLMRELSGLSHEEIAAALETSVSAAKQCIYEARRDLAELAAGRATPCDDICRHISDGDRRVLRGRRVAAHLRSCSSCADFASVIDTRTTDLHALAPWLSPFAAAAVLDGAFRAGSGAGAAGTAAGAAAGTTAGAAGTSAGAAGTSAVAGAPAAVTAGVMSKAVGIPLVGKSLLAVVAVTAGVASAVGAGGAGHATSRPVPSRARLGSPRAAGPAHAVRADPARHATRHTPAASRAGATPRHSVAAPARGAGRRLAGGQSSHVAPGHAKQATSIAPGQAKKSGATTAPPGQAKRTGTTAAPPRQVKKSGTTTPPGHVKKATRTPPGQAKKTDATAPPGQAKKTAATAPSGQAKKTGTTTPPGQVKKVASAASGAVNTVARTASGQAEKLVTPPSGQTKPADALPPGQTNAASAADNSAAHSAN